jgi:hypothetical protein
MDFTGAAHDRLGWVDFMKDLSHGKILVNKLDDEFAARKSHLLHSPMMRGPVDWEEIRFIPGIMLSKSFEHGRSGRSLAKKGVWHTLRWYPCGW